MVMAVELTDTVTPDMRDMVPSGTVQAATLWDQPTVPLPFPRDITGFPTGAYLTLLRRSLTER